MMLTVRRHKPSDTHCDTLGTQLYCHIQMLELCLDGDDWGPKSADARPDSLCQISYWLFHGLIQSSQDNAGIIIHITHQATVDPTHVFPVRHLPITSPFEARRQFYCDWANGWLIQLSILGTGQNVLFFRNVRTCPVFCDGYKAAMVWVWPLN
jgi:hypothetical protein